MKCIEIAHPGGPEVLRMVERPVPTLDADSVLIKVAAAGINRPDVLQRAGHYPPPPGASDLPGLEVAGLVTAIGTNVKDLHPGAQVCALVPGGGYAEYCVTPAIQCLPIPSGLDVIGAAALPETFFTVWFNLFMQAELPKARTFLVHGGASGIGTTAIQLAHQFGVRVFTTVSSATKQRACESLGAELAINYHEENFVTVVKEITNGTGVDIVLDMVGGEYFRRNMDVLAPQGRLVIIAFLAGSELQFDFRPILFKNLTVTGSTLRPQPVSIKGMIAAGLRSQVWPLLANQKIKPIIHKTFSLDAAAAAHAMMESNVHIGKLVLEVDRTLI